MAAKGDEALLGHVKILNLLKADRRDGRIPASSNLRSQIFSEAGFGE